MVGSVLLERMMEEKDFDGSFEATFFTTSNVGGQGPNVGQSSPPLVDAFSIADLSAMDVVVSCQGGDYTNEVHPKLRQSGWKGYWIDAASALRMKDDAIIVLDPVNRAMIDKGLQDGIRDYVGGNCTVSLMLMALAGLFEKGWVEWMTSMTYQAASGAGAKNMRELVLQMEKLGAVDPALKNDRANILDLDRAITKVYQEDSFPKENFGAPLAGALIPWIDKAMENGQTKEEWKGIAETNKILGTSQTIPIDGQCVRIGAMRCHSQAITIKLKQDVPMDQIEAAIASHNQWVRVIPNTKESTVAELSPAVVNGKLIVPVGRLRKMTLGPEYLTCFTVGDQLLWGAAEPVRRMLKIVLCHMEGKRWQ
ncbi:hypothetical protein GUITHDRAFT_106207 [Guillardia theta CCMP2712]|uniref:aspartate-semialdehyde dehydrogenase n=2 Tax=Guillardia theta TaxID=55529 RepID=L1JJ60_GUITC|nr:hypothetical protein GUITHDRAFT_106207 [Guillardia theta CCMP2712]EKX48130.1 hypothetical protein GUITHDRAFT_106207 [Guillardia theta CCMP2712]|eukprot:XP_005835110.1 hypothetical protein GUITHDRAFT_106207 [Guillardia theta CCMP2712]